MAPELLVAKWTLPCEGRKAQTSQNVEAQGCVSCCYCSGAHEVDGRCTETAHSPICSEKKKKKGCDRRVYFVPHNRSVLDSQSVPGSLGK